MKNGKLCCPILGWIAFVLVVIGAINWGLVGIAGFNLVDYIFSGAPVIARIIYIVVGISGLVMIYYGCSRCCKRGHHCE